MALRQTRLRQLKLTNQKDRALSAPVGNSYRYSSSRRTPRGSATNAYTDVILASGDWLHVQLPSAPTPCSAPPRPPLIPQEPHSSTTAREERLAGLGAFSRLAGQAFRR